MLNILIPLAGKNTYKTTENNVFPKFFHEINGELLVERAAAPFINIQCDKRIIVAAPKLQIRDYQLDKVLTLLDSSISMCSINSDTQGAACSALLAIDQLELNGPLIISNFDQVLNINLTAYLNKFIKSDADAGVLTFNAIHPKWSFVKTDMNGYVTEAAEKRPISNTAIAGLYYFKTAQLFIDSAKNMIRKDVTTNDLFYISHTLNEIILNEGKVKALPIEKSNYFHIHDEHALEAYEEAMSKNPSTLQKNLTDITQEYIDAFDAKDINKVSSHFSSHFRLTDPSVSLQGKDKVTDYIDNIFNTVKQLSFTGKDIIIAERKSIIEFELIVDGDILFGVDVIEWDDNNKMISMNAYLYGKK